VRPSLGLGRRWLGYGVVCALIIVQMFASGLINHNHDFTSSAGDFNRLVYTKPWCRVTPFAVGMGLALLWYERVAPVGSAAFESVARRLWRQALLLVAGAAMLAVVMLAYDKDRCVPSGAATSPDVPVMYADGCLGLFSKGRWSVGAWAAYQALSYLAWSVSLAFGCYCAFCGHGGLVSTFLSMSVWGPLARLTYGAYLIHLVLMSLLAYSVVAEQSYSGVAVTQQWISYVAMAYFCSYLLYLLVEKPAMNLVALLLKRPHTARPQPDQEAREDKALSYGRLGLVVESSGPEGSRELRRPLL
jgi:peptidoglycan/LPS O-acetylase OafA/YrhL